MWHMSGFMCHVSHGRCHTVGVTRQVSGVTCQVIFFLNFFVLEKVVELDVGGSVINGAYPV